jgi:hypothetical protein
MLAKSSAELRDVRHGRGIQEPQHVLVERLDAFAQADLNAIGQQVVLTQQVLPLNVREQFRIVSFANGHAASATTSA